MEFNSKFELSETEYNNLITLFDDISSSLTGSERDLMNKIKKGIKNGWETDLKRAEVLDKIKSILAQQTFSNQYHDQPDKIKAETKIKGDLDFENDRLQGIIKDLLNEYLQEQGSEKSITDDEIVKPKKVKDLAELVFEKIND